MIDVFCPRILITIVKCGFGLRASRSETPYNVGRVLIRRNSTNVIFRFRCVCIAAYRDIGVCFMSMHLRASSSMRSLYAIRFFDCYKSVKTSDSFISHVYALAAMNRNTKIMKKRVYVQKYRSVSIDFCMHIKQTRLKISHAVV